LFISVISRQEGFKFAQERALNSPDASRSPDDNEGREGDNSTDSPSSQNHL
jgi:hypothetical protein